MEVAFQTKGCAKHPLLLSITHQEHTRVQPRRAEFHIPSAPKPNRDTFFQPATLLASVHTHAVSETSLTSSQALALVVAGLLVAGLVMAAVGSRGVSDCTANV
jgi:hypothetical protein